MATMCSNIHCVKHTEDRGGRFLFHSGDKQWYCVDCMNQRQVAGCRELWNFTTTHFTGERTHVKSLAHLRQLEKHHGVSNQLANNFEKNCV